jgi:hypothetical protein
MKKLNVDILKDSSLLKHYRIIRRWACKNNNLNDADLELLIYFDCLELFTKQDYKTGTLAYSWDSQRWNRLLKNGWIVVWRKRNRTTQKYHIYKVSFKCKQLITRIYKMMLDEIEIPLIKKPKKYSDKVLLQAIKNINYGS